MFKCVKKYLESRQCTLRMSANTNEVIELGTFTHGITFFVDRYEIELVLDATREVVVALSLKQLLVTLEELLKRKLVLHAIEIYDPPKAYACIPVITIFYDVVVETVTYNEHNGMLKIKFASA